MAYWVWQQLKFINICICTVVVIVFFVSLSLFWKKNRIVKVLRVITNIVIEVIITHIYIAIFWNRGLFLRRLWWFCSAPPTSPGPHELVRDFVPTHSELNIAHMCSCPSILARSLQVISDHSISGCEFYLLAVKYKTLYREVETSTSFTLIQWL